jgi:uncharacterized coiled-coil DUF342 family protein
MEQTKRTPDAIDAEAAPIRAEYDAKRDLRKSLREQIAKLTNDERDIVRELHALGDKLEALRIEKRNVLKPPRVASRPPRNRP